MVLISDALMQHLLRYLSTAHLGYVTFKHLHSKPSKTQNNQILLRWIMAIAFLYSISILDYFCFWFPTYYFWRTIGGLVIIIDQDIPVKVFFKLEKVITTVQLYMDSIVYPVYKTVNYLSYPAFKTTFQSFVFLANFADPQQVSQIENLVCKFRKQIQTLQVAQANRGRKSLPKIQNKPQPKPRTGIPPQPTPKKGSSPSRSSWKIVVDFQKKTTPGLPERFFSYDLWFDQIQAKICWRAKGDDLSYSDFIKQVKVRDQKTYKLEIVTKNQSQVLKFPNMSQYNKWKKFLESKCQQMQSPIDNFLLQCPYPSEHKQKIRSDLIAVSTRQPQLVVNIKSVFQGGRQIRLCALEGTIPIQFNGNRYNIPILCYIPARYPLRPPIIYVTPVQGMVIKPNQYAQQDGLVMHPKLQNWDPRKVGLGEVITDLSAAFSQECPVYRSRNQPQTGYSQPQPISQNSGTAVYVANANRYAVEFYNTHFEKIMSQIEHLKRCEQDLTNRKRTLVDVQQGVQRSSGDLQQKIEELERWNFEVQERIRNSQGGSSDFIEEVLPKEPVQKEILSAVSTEKALQRMIGLMQRQFEKGQFPASEFVRQYRELTNRQFMAARLREKLVFLTTI